MSRRLRKQEPLTAEIARATWHYDPETGLLRWRANKRRARAGAIAGKADSVTGYVRVRFMGLMYGVHRLAFLIVEGRWPVPTVDHENKIRGDNRWENIHEATYSEQTLASPKRNPHGHRGVTLDKATGKWRAQMWVDGTNIYIGSFGTAEDAAAAYSDHKQKRRDEAA